MLNKIALSGLMFTGKDHLARQLDGFQIMGFADPIYDLVKFYTGTADKAVPGIRRMMQLIGQWGWGKLDEEYPHSVERSLITQQIRYMGGTMAPQYQDVEWKDYGLRKDFWVHNLLERMRALEMNPGKTRGVITTNARFEHELAPLKASGFRHYMVCCSEETRRKRLESAGHVYHTSEQNDASEQCARAWSRNPPEGMIFVWNDAGFTTTKEILPGSVISAETFVKSHQSMMHPVPGIPLRMGAFQDESEADAVFMQNILNRQAVA